MTEEEARQIISPIGGGGTGDGFLPSYIVGETPYASDWLSDEVSGDPITPEEGLLYLILTHGDYYSGFYRYLESESSYVLVGNARIRELTRAEYFTLTEDEKNDGTVYFITDDGGPQPIDLPDRGFTPVGTIIAVMGNTAPKYYLACDGATYNIVTYPELAAYFADQFGSANYFGGDGTNTFAVPDLRGEFLRGTGTNSHENQGSGSDVGDHQDATDIPNIGITTSSEKAVYGYTKETPTLKQNADSEHEATSTGFSGTSGTPWTTSNKNVYYTSRPTNTSVLYCIAVKDIYIYSVDVSTKGGHEIKDNGVAVTDRDVLNFTDFDIADDSTNEETDIKAHRLTQAEMSEIMSNPPGATLADGNPVGTVISFMGVNAPYGYLVCDGTAYSITDYQRLADHITNQFGSVDFFGGNGTTTFAVPDLRGEFLRGTGTNSHTNQGSGANVGTHQDATKHVFEFQGGSSSNEVFRGTVDGSGYITDTNRDSTYRVNADKQVLKTGGSTVSDLSSGNTAFTSRPTNTSVLYCIKF